MMLPRTLDRGTVKLMAIKRLITGTLSVALGVGAIIFAVQRQAAGSASAGATDAQTKLMFAALLAICFGGGAWSLRDGVRTLRMIRQQ